MSPTTDKPGAVPMKRTPKQIAAAEKAAAKQALDAQAAQLAQIVNLHIAGFSLEQIGAQIGATAEEIDRRLNNEASRYVRNQPALRTYVRNFISGKYSHLLEAVWDEATDKKHPMKLENQDRALRILKEMSNLHGAAAPVQTEMKIEAAPEAVERLVQALSTGQGLGYDTDIFDIPEEDIHEAVVQSDEATEVSGNLADQPQEGEPDDGF